MGRLLWQNFEQEFFSETQCLDVPPTAQALARNHSRFQGVELREDRTFNGWKISPDSSD